MKKAKTVAIIGAGIAGLAAAIRIQKLGFQVTVFESNKTVGGKMNERNSEGFRFDKGPTVLTKPEYVDELFELCGKSASDYWNHQPVNPIFKYFFEDGTIINSSQNIDDFSSEIASKTNATKQSVVEHLNQAKTKYELTDEVFLQRPFYEQGKF
jgi:phytoene desaturase